MTETLSTIRTYLDQKLGRCATCMRQALASTLIVGALFVAAALIGLPPFATALIGLAALGLGALWLTHVMAFTMRAKDQPDIAGRRAALGTMLRVASIGVAFSIPVATWSTKAMAFCGQCTNDEGCGPCCKCVNTAPVNSGKVCNECKPK